jgi:hypothetical protein
MKTASVAGIVLLILGVIGVAYGGISYTRHKEVARVGSIHAEKNVQETIPIPPVLGGIALVAGVVLLVAGSKSRTP